MKIDHEAVRTLRLDAGLSVRLIARSAGLTSGAINRIEAGVDVPHMTLRSLEGLAEALGTYASNLLDETPTPATPDTQDHVSSLGAALLAHPGGIALDALADLLHATLPDLEIAITHAKAAFALVGCHLVDAENMLRLRPDPAVAPPPERATEAIAAAEARSDTSAGGIAGAVTAALNRKTFDYIIDDANGHLTAYQALAAGLLHLGDKTTQPPTVDPDVRYSLMLDTSLPDQ